MGFGTAFATGAVQGALDLDQQARQFNNKAQLENLRANNELTNWRVHEEDQAKFRMQEQDNLAKNQLKLYQDKSGFDQAEKVKEENRKKDLIWNNGRVTWGLPDTPEARQSLDFLYDQGFTDIHKIHDFLKDGTIQIQNGTLRLAPLSNGRDTIKVAGKDTTVLMPDGTTQTARAVDKFARDPVTKQPTSYLGTEYQDATGKPLVGANALNSMTDSERLRIPAIIKNDYAADRLKMSKVLLPQTNPDGTPVIGKDGRPVMQETMLSTPRGADLLAKLIPEIESTADIIAHRGAVTSAQQAVNAAVWAVENKYKVNILSNPSVTPSVDTNKLPEDVRNMYPNSYPAKTSSAPTVPNDIMTRVTELNGGKPIKINSNGDVIGPLTPEAKKFLEDKIAEKASGKATTPVAPGAPGAPTTPVPEAKPEAAAQPTQPMTAASLNKTMRNAPEALVKAGTAGGNTMNYDAAGNPAPPSNTEAKTPGNQLTLRDVLSSGDIPKETVNKFKILGDTLDAPIPNHVDTAEELSAWLAVTAGAVGLSVAPIPVTLGMRKLLESRNANGIPPAELPDPNSKANRLEKATGPQEKIPQVEIPERSTVDTRNMKPEEKPAPVTSTSGKGSGTLGNNVTEVPESNEKRPTFGKRVAKASTEGSGKMGYMQEGTPVEPNPKAMTDPKNTRAAEVSKLQLLGMVNQPARKRELDERIAEIKENLNSQDPDISAKARLTVDKIKNDEWFKAYDMGYEKPAAGGELSTLSEEELRSRALAKAVSPSEKIAAKYATKPELLNILKQVIKGVK